MAMCGDLGLLVAKVFADPERFIGADLNPASDIQSIDKCSRMPRWSASTETQKSWQLTRKKAARQNTVIAFIPGILIALPFSAHTFDRVCSTLVMSLLMVEQKELALQEAYRVLKSHGELHLADFGPPHTTWVQRIAPLMRRFEPMAGNLNDLLPVFFKEAGFGHVIETARHTTPFGMISNLTGQKP